MWWHVANMSLGIGSWIWTHGCLEKSVVSTLQQCFDILRFYWTSISGILELFLGHSCTKTYESLHGGSDSYEAYNQGVQCELAHASWFADLEEGSQVSCFIPIFSYMHVGGTSLRLIYMFLLTLWYRVCQNRLFQLLILPCFEHSKPWHYRRLLAA